MTHRDDSIGEDVCLKTEVVNWSVARAMNTRCGGWTIRNLPHAEFDRDGVGDIYGPVVRIDLRLNAGHQTMECCSNLRFRRVVRQWARLRMAQDSNDTGCVGVNIGDY